MYKANQWQPTPVLLPGKSHGRRSLVGCSPWGCEESDITQRLHFHFHFTYSYLAKYTEKSMKGYILLNINTGNLWEGKMKGNLNSSFHIFLYILNFYNKHVFMDYSHKLIFKYTKGLS